MNPQDPLSQLQALRSPAAIDWWPPAPGWWLLLALLILACAGLSIGLLLRYRRNAYRRIACKQLGALRQQYLQDNDSGRYAADLNALLKRVASKAFAAETVSALHGKAWLDFLNSQSAPLQFDASLAAAAYAKQAPDIDVEQTHSAALRWIGQHGKRQ